MDNTVSVYEKLELLHFTISEAIDGNTGELSNALELVEELREPYLKEETDAEGSWKKTGS